MITIKIEIDEELRMRANAWKRSLRRRGPWALLVAAVVFPIAAYATPGAITKANTFADGQVISAAAVNQNFDDLFAKVNDNDARLTTQEGEKDLVSKSGVIAYALFSTTPAAGGTTASAQGSFSSSGMSIVATRTGVGVYSVDFAGQNGNTDGAVIATAFRTAGATCQWDGWATSTGATVKCYDATGAAVDTGFNLLLIK